MKLNLVATAIFIAVLISVPSAMAACHDLISAKPGDPVTLAMTPDGSYLYQWTPDVTLPEQTDVNLRTFSFEAPVVGTFGFADEAAAAAWLALEPQKTDLAGTSASSLVGCRVIRINGMLTTRILRTPVEGTPYYDTYSACVDDCNVYLKVCPRPCPTLDEDTLCINEWDTKYPDDWTLSAGTAADWEDNDVFTWKLYDETDALVSTHTGTGADPTHTFVLGDFVPAPTNADPEECFTIELTVTSAAPASQTLLGPCTVGKMCLIFDPASGTGISITRTS